MKVRLALIVLCAFLALQTTVLAGSAGEKRPAIGTRPSIPTLVVWTDPVEGAFRVKVPKGWLVAGGTHRNAPTDAEMWVQAKTSDGTIEVWMGYPYILPHQEPNPAYYSLGWYPGRVVQAQTGPLLILPFETGAQFARSFSEKFKCKTSQALSLFDLPDETRRMQQAVSPLAAEAGVGVTTSAGEFVYRCGSRMGYTNAVTVLSYGSNPSGPRIWAVYKLFGYQSDKAKVAIARYALNSLAASFKVDANWQARFQQQIHDTYGELMAITNRITQESIQTAQQSLEQNTRMIDEQQRAFDQETESSMASFKNQQASEDSIRQRWSDITLGQVHGCDELGNCQTVSNDYEYYWTKDGKTVVGGPSDGSPPGPEYHAWTPDN